jgi:predicted DNA binding CopG/RHH family protein
MVKLDKDEKDILDSVERGEWRSSGITKGERKRYGRYAEATFRKDRRVNIRLSGKDLEAIQKRALAEGLPSDAYLEPSPQICGWAARGRCGAAFRTHFNANPRARSAGN